MRIVKVKGLIPAALGMIALAYSTRAILMLAGIQHPGVWCNTLARLDPIAYGIILAACLKGRRPTLSGGTCAVLGVVAVSMWLVVARYAPLDGLLPMSLMGGYPAVAAASALMVLLALACDLSTLPKWISDPGIYLGRISYGLYVFHMLAISIFGWAHVYRFSIRLLGSLILTIVLSAASYRYLEQPFLKLKLKYTHVLSRPGG
jgi:peptidoglycan/LPS O-acetylase OafA/YrhL